MTDNDQGISQLNSTDRDDVEGLKDKKQEIRGDQGWPDTNPPMVKLAFSRERKNSPLKERILLLKKDSVWKEKYFAFSCRRFVPFYRFKKWLSVG